MTYLLLFYEVFKAGLFAIGGGLATLPFLYDMADKYPWFTRTDLANMIAVSHEPLNPLDMGMCTIWSYSVNSSSHSFSMLSGDGCEVTISAPSFK